MLIDLKLLLKGKETAIKKKQYLATREYIEPFIDQLSKFTDNFICQAKLPDQVTMEDNIVDYTFNRVYIQAVLPKSYWEFDNHQEVIGLVYGLDVRKPIYKLYRGGLNMGCTNLCIFNPSFLNVQEIKPAEKLDFKPIKALMEMTSDLEVELTKMKTTFLSRDQESIESYLGHWCDYVIRNEYNVGLSKAKLSVATAVDAYKDLFIDTESGYYIPDNEEPSVFNIYNAFTEYISHDKKDIVNTAEKTLLLNNMLLPQH
nr:MAG TPA: hypothetical protein [Caudoviricetes sp.]